MDEQSSVVLQLLSVCKKMGQMTVQKPVWKKIHADILFFLQNNI